jgi:RNA polymerase sigma-70 factor (ECF subfamily)
MEQNKSADSEWVQSAIKRFESSLNRYAASLTGDRETARDVVQDTFVRLCQQSREQINGCLAEWLFTVCRHRALDLRRKDSRVVALTQINLDEEAAGEPTPAVAAEHNEDASEVLGLVAQLPAQQQELLRLKFQAGLTYEQISRVTKLSVSNVGYLLHTAIKTLRRGMRAREEKEEQR